MSDFLSAAKWTDKSFPEPHQIAAWNWAWSKLSKDEQAEFFSMFRAAPAAKKTSFDPAIKLLKEFEGCRLAAYPDPASGGNPWTIGYGTVRYPDGRNVARGDKLTVIEAESLLLAEVDRIASHLSNKIPYWAQMTVNQQSALISFAYNLGEQFYGSVDFETISRCLRDKDWSKVPAAFELYRNPGSSVEAGLLRRRRAEGALWLAGKLPEIQQSGPSHLRLTRTKKLTPAGLEQLKLEYVKAGSPAASILVVSGAPGAQQFRTGAASRSGSLEPLPEGRWGIEDVAWAAGKDNYAGNWGPGLGPVSTPLRYLGPGKTERSAIEIHIDSNARTSPGTAGCIGIANEADYRKFVSWLRESDPRDLYVDYGLGTCPAAK